jgi:hypothetical protein
MVWPITGAESYVWKTSKSMKAMELAVTEKDCCRKISPIDDSRLFYVADLETEATYTSANSTARYQDQ